MGGDRLKKNLEKLHRETPVDSTRRQALEDSLLLSYRKNHSQKKRWINMLNPHKPFARYAVIGLALLLLGVGACSTETTTEVEVGQQVSIDLAQGAAAFDKSVDMDARVHEMVDMLGQIPGVEGLNVNINNDDGNVELNVLMFGDSLDGEAVVNMVRADFPELANAEIAVQPLAGTITESWAERFGREVFHLETDGASVEEIQAQVMQQLAEQGFEGDAQVDVTDDGDQRRIEIKLNEDVDE